MTNNPVTRSRWVGRVSADKLLQRIRTVLSKPKRTMFDQNRVMTPKDALKQGANFLVIGRPITEAKNIKKALLEIHNSI